MPPPELAAQGNCTRLPLTPSISTAVRVLNGIEDLLEFRWALGALTPCQRAILILRYWDDLSEAEVAEVLECPVGTVKSSASRAVVELRRILGRGAETIPMYAPSEVYKEDSW